VTPLKKLTRLVTFRLSDAEYEALRSACELHGVRSVSEFGRDAVLSRMHTLAKTTVSLGEDLTTLGTRLEDLDEALRDLSGHISRVLGARTTNHNNH
jgi:hypothetical protein